MAADGAMNLGGTMNLAGTSVLEPEVALEEEAWRTPVEPLLYHIKARLIVDPAGASEDLVERGPVVAEVYVYPSDTVHALRKALSAKACVDHVSGLMHEGVPVPDHLSVQDAGLQNHSEVDMTIISELAVASGSADGDIRIWNARLREDQCLDTLRAHTEPVLWTRFSLAGDRLATASQDSTARLWNTGTKECLSVLTGHDDWVNSVTFSPDGEKVATASMDRSVKLWDAEVCECIRTIEGHTSPLYSAEFSPDGKFIAACGSPRSTDVQLWEVATGKCVRVLMGGVGGGHEDNVLCFCFSADGQQCLTGSQDKTAKVWDVGKAQCLSTFSGHTAAISAACFTQDSKLVVTGSHDRCLRVWDAGTEKCLRTLQGHNGSIATAAVAPDSQTIVSGSRDMTVRLWDFKTGRCLQKMEGHKSKVHSVTYVPY